MSNDFATLDQWIESIGALPEVPKRAAELVAEPALEAMRKPVAAGTSPDGEAWAKRKKDGARAYANAASAIGVRAEGSTLRFTITRKPEVLGHVGVRGAPPRPMLPTVTPDAVSDAIRDRLGEEFTRVTSGGK